MKQITQIFLEGESPTLINKKLLLLKNQTKFQPNFPRITEKIGPKICLQKRIRSSTVAIR